MLPKGIAYPHQLAVLTKALQEYCAEAGIEPGTLEYEDASRRMMDLHERGVTCPKDLASGMKGGLRHRRPQGATVH